MSDKASVAKIILEQLGGNRFIVEADNDTGPDDDCYHQFWRIIDTAPDHPDTPTQLCICDHEDFAELIVKALNDAEIYRTLLSQYADRLVQIAELTKLGR